MKSQNSISNKIEKDTSQNWNVYTKEELKLFNNTVCQKLQLTTISKIIEISNHNHENLKIYIAAVAAGDQKSYTSYANGFAINNVTETAKKYHIDLFDIMYIRKLDELPLMIHDDQDLTPVINWRFEIGK